MRERELRCHLRVLLTYFKQLDISKSILQRLHILIFRLAAHPDTRQERNFQAEVSHEDHAYAALESNADITEVLEKDNLQDNPDVARLTSPLLVVSVIFSAFAYGPILVRLVYTRRGPSLMQGNGQPFFPYLNPINTA